MNEPQEIPPMNTLPLDESRRRSRRPLLVLGSRASTVPTSSRTRSTTLWTKVELALITADSADSGHRYYISHEVLLASSPPTTEDLDHACAEIRTWRMFAHTPESPPAVCAPSWTEMDYRARRRLWDQAMTGIAIDAGVEGPYPFGPAEIYTVTTHRNSPQPYRLTRVDPLPDTRPCPDLSGDDLSETAIGKVIQTGSPTDSRDYPRACETARRLRAEGWSKSDIIGYLEVYGYLNRAGIRGRWHRTEHLARALEPRR